MSKLVIFGLGNMADQAYFYFSNDSDHEVVAFTADAEFVDRMLRFDWKLTLADNDLRKVNGMCAAAGVDVVYPLLDDSLVDFSLRIPAAVKMKNRELRHFYRLTHAPKIRLIEVGHG